MSGDAVPRSIGRVLDLLEVVVDRRSCTLTEAADAVGLTPTTALRHLRALETRGYLHRDDDGVFSAGPAVRRLVSVVADGQPLDRLIAAAQPHLDDLATVAGESSYLLLRGDRVATYVAMAESDRAVRHVGWVGQQITLNGTAAGSAFSERGSVAVRQGAVEPDITAMSLALPAIGELDVAVSIIGPSHRVDQATDRLSNQLVEVVTTIAAKLGLEQAA